MATNPFQNLAFPQSSMAARPTMQPAAAPVTAAAPSAAQRQRTAYLAALANPDKPIEPQFSTGSTTADEQARLRARYARMLAAGQSAVAERAAAQGRLQGTDPVTGAPIVGAATPSPIVQESPGGVRVAYRNGVPVGFSTPQPTMPFVGEAQQIIPTATRLAADQSAARMRAAQILRAAGATAPAVAAAQAAPVAAAPAPAPAMPLPTVPARPTPLASAPFRDASGRVDTAAVAEAQGRVPSAARQPVVNQPAPTEAEVEQALADAAVAEEAALTQATEQRAQMATEQFDRQLAALTRQIADATRRGDAVAIRRLRNEIDRIRNQRLAAVEPAIIDVGSPMF